MAHPSHEDVQQLVLHRTVSGMMMVRAWI